MPQFTAEFPHVITCLKRSFRDVLIAYSGDDLTVVCDRSDCWSDKELFKHRQAVNIQTGVDSTTTPIKSPQPERKRLGEARVNSPAVCAYKARLNLTVQIYVEDCEFCDDESDCECLNGTDKAYAILGHIQRTIALHKDEVQGYDVFYRSSNHVRDTEGEFDLVLLSAEFEITYQLDPANPTAVSLNN